MGTSFANAGRFVPIALKSGTAVSAGMLRWEIFRRFLLIWVSTSNFLRLLTPDYYKEKFFPLNIDQNMPFEHLMKVNWSWNVIKFGGLAMLSKLTQPKNSTEIFSRHCEISMVNLLKELNLNEAIDRSPYNLWLKPQQAEFLKISFVFFISCF